MAVLPTPGYPPKAPGAQEPCSAAHIGIRRTGFIPRKDLRLPIAIKMPALSPTMEEGTLAKWLVKVGDKVSSGDIMAEIETDKATMEFEAVDEGTIAAIEVAEGSEGVKVGTVIALLAGEDEDGAVEAPAAKQPDKASGNTEAPVQTPARAAAAAAAASPASGEPQASATQPRSPTAGGENGAAKGSAKMDEGRVIASPLARRIAADKA